MAKKHHQQKQVSGKKHEKGHGSAEKMQGDEKGEKSNRSNRTDRHDPRTDDQR